MNADKSIGISQISYDLECFEIIIRANYLLSLRDRKQRTFQQVVDQMLESAGSLDEVLIKEVEAQHPCAGHAILALRLNRQQQLRAENIKNKVLEGFGYHWQLRDVVIYLCKGLIKDLS